MYWTDLDTKTIGIWGMGREGLAAQKALNKHCPKATLISIGEENTVDIKKCDILIKSPGVSLYRPEIQQAITDGVVVTSGSNLFFANKNPSTRVIAVTGTKGKSTTASLLTHTLKALGQRVELGGNIGRPLLDLVDTNPDWVVAELSSYQCADLGAQPDIGVLVNLYPEHLQWHGTHEQYYADKLHLIKACHQIVLNATDPRTQSLTANLSATFFNDPKGIHATDDRFYDGNQPLFERQNLPLVGHHNVENACAVLTVIKLLDLPLVACGKAFQSFTALPHRLQIIGSRNGLTYVDDSISTTPETALAALQALNKGQPMTLIAGGLDRGQNYTLLVDYLVKHKETIKIVTLPETGVRLTDMAQRHGVEAVPTTDMPTAVSIARHITPTGGTILLSPAAPSYNMYPNFEARGDDFKKWAFLD